MNQDNVPSNVLSMAEYRKKKGLELMWDVPLYNLSPTQQQAYARAMSRTKICQPDAET